MTFVPDFKLKYVLELCQFFGRSTIILKNQGKQCEGENRMSFMDLLFAHLLALCLPPKFCTRIKYCFQFLLG